MNVLSDILIFLLYVAGFIVALMPLFLYGELRRQGRQRAEEATRVIYHLRKIADALTPQVVEDDRAEGSQAETGSVMPSGRRVVIRR
jgi:hypothetical protein